MGQTVMALKFRKKMNGASKQNLVGAAAWTYEHNPSSFFRSGSKAASHGKSDCRTHYHLQIAHPHKNTLLYIESRQFWSKPFTALHYWCSPTTLIGLVFLFYLQCYFILHAKLFYSSKQCKILVFSNSLKHFYYVFSC